MKKFTISLLALLAISIGASAQYRMSEASKKVATTLAIIENLYVDKIDDAKLAEDAVKSILEKLDPHSTYISPSEVKEMNEPLEGNFDGIGIVFNMMTDTVYVIETIAGGPSEKVGLRAGDKIIMVNDTLIAGQKMSTRKVMSKLKGKKGTSVRIQVLRKGEKELIEFKITRDKIPYNSLDASYMADDRVGYILLSRFGATTSQEFRDAVKKLKAEGMKDLILDLEYNGGGYLSAAIDLADDFLGKDKLIVYTEGRSQPKQTVNATSKGCFEEGKLVILINQYSASASEIVSGAVQDWDRGVVVGRRSFGKGLVQSQFPLPDQSQIRVTVARYHTPTGRCIQKPYTMGDIDSYHKDLVDRYNKGEMLSADSIHFPDSLKYETLINKRPVYGNGGIMPDYYVTVDTTKYPTQALKLNFVGIPYKVAHNEVDLHRNEIKEKYTTSIDFFDKYEVTDELLDKIREGGKEEKIELTDEEFEKVKPLFRNNMKALIARDLFDTNTQFRVVNQISEIYQKAYEIIKDDSQYQKLIGNTKE